VGGLFALMGFFVFYASLDNPQLEQVEIDLFSVEVLEVDTVKNSAILEVSFLVGNPSEKTFTIPSITYELYADGIELGQSKYSTEDISMPGRVAFLPGFKIPLKSEFILTESIVDSSIYQAIVSGEDVDYTANGIITAETSWSLVEKEF
jgi:LEA14-like dessication related protein